MQERIDMTGEYEKAISILEAIDAIQNRDYLLPAIQRKFVWSSHQICVLFDSIMRGYPINTFMMWEIKSDQIKNDYKFYGFLDFYCQRFNEENPHVPTSASFKNFKAIIDGQQRLTSLFIGLCSTYAYKQPRVWWPSARDEKVLPPRKLYLDLMQPVKSEDDESLMQYNFRFLTEQQYQDSLVIPKTHHWFCLHEIMRFAQVEGGNHVWNKIVKPYLESAGLDQNVYAQDTLAQLYDVIRSQKIIHYFNETRQEIDHILDVFIRTNSGGTKLDFSDLLMSIAVANWDGDFRKELDDLVSYIYQSVEMGFYLERDWVLKTCLMLTGADVRFKVKNFKSEQVGRIQQKWAGIKECIKATMLLIRRFGINPQSLTSKNAVIPICYFLYKKEIDGAPLYLQINNLAKCHDYRNAISQWFYMVLLKGVFGGQADSILTSMRDVLDANMDSSTYPLPQIIERYKATNKDLRFDEDYVDSLLGIEYGEGKCRALLHLLFPEMNPTEVFHIDHLHPKSMFEKSSLKKQNFLQNDSELLAFYADAKNWNTIPNLHLLNHSQNLSKKGRPLADWVADKNVNLTAKDFLSAGVSLNFADFRTFYEKRRLALRERLKSRVFMSNALPVVLEQDDSDEEVVEENVP